MEARSRSVVYVLLLLACASGAVLVSELAPDPRRREAVESFQRAVGGLGFGPVLDLSGCAFGFDPRLDGSCSAAAGPLPGGACFCGRHGGLLPYGPLDPEAIVTRGGGRAIPLRD